MKAILTFAQSEPDNVIASALRVNSIKKCIIYKDSSGFRIPHYELHFNEKGLNTTRIMGTDIDEYQYNLHNVLIDWSFCLNGDSLWCLRYKYLYNEQGILNKVLYTDMPSNRNLTDSTIYVYQDTLLTEKLFYKNGQLSYKTLISYKSTENGITITESSFKNSNPSKVAIYRYDLNGKMIFRRFEYQCDRPMLTTSFIYDDLGREITYVTYSGQDDSLKYTNKTFYQKNGLIDRVQTPDFTLYYKYE